MNESLDTKLSTMDKKAKMLSRVLVGILALLAILTFFNNFQIGIQVNNENETAKRYRKTMLENGVALDAYVDSVDYKNETIAKKEKAFDSVVDVNNKRGETIKTLNHEIKKLTDSLHAVKRVKVYSIQPRN